LVSPTKKATTDGPKRFLVTFLLLFNALFYDEAHSQLALKHLHFWISKCDQRLFQDDESREYFVNVLRFLQLAEFKLRHGS
jgi:hypothetical protein